MSFLLVHSPAVGPSTWRWVAESLRARGQDVVVPDLIGAAQVGDPRGYAEAAAASVKAPSASTVVVGHSGAGPLLPIVAAGLAGRPRLIVFVDAGVPPCESTFAQSSEMLNTLRDLATDGVLPPWSQWWGPGVLEAMIEDDARRLRVESELPRLPVSFYEMPLAMPSNWCSSRCAYVLVSDAYREDAGRGAERGWSVIEKQGSHLDIVNDGDAFANLIVELLGP